MSRRRSLASIASNAPERCRNVGLGAVFERFTERARQVVVLAQDEARNLKHNYIGTEHLLLGLLREEDGLAARVLASLDVTLEEVRAQVERIIGRGDELASGQIPFTPRAKKVLELALREAQALSSNHIGTEHILLGIMRENDGVAARILLDFDIDAEKVRKEVARMLGGAGRPRREFPPPASSFQLRGTSERRVLDFGRSFVTLPEALALGGIVGAGIGVVIGWAIWGL
jgi:ATP-dependent Clp protease ATP-binding subunit ClpC